VRRAAYYSLLAGPPAGVSYCAHGIWFWSRKAEVPLDHPRRGVADPWSACLNYPGAQQMKVLRSIFDSIEWWRLRPDRSLLKEDVYDAATFQDYIMSAMAEKDDLACSTCQEIRKSSSTSPAFDRREPKELGTIRGPARASRPGSWTAASDVVKTPGQGD
jgi:hypothetical protein